MNRDINGIIDHLLDQAEEVSTRTDIELEKKIKMTDQVLKNVWKAASLNLAHKTLMLRAPDIAQNKDVTLQLGTTKAKPETPDKTPVTIDATPAAA